MLFGSFPVGTHSMEARQLVEQALDQYENVMLRESLESARKAVEKDPKFALAYAVWSFTARRDQPAPEVVSKAKALAVSAPDEERLLVHFMTATQSPDLLPAIQAMNDLLARFPKNKHVLYLTAEWLYFQQDYERSRNLFEGALQVDANFPPALNMLGYAYVETGNPDPAKAVAALRRYAQLLPGQPNPHDSLGEVFRYAGDDTAALQEYSAALKISPNFYTSQLGLGDTAALMGDFARARAEFDKAVSMAPSSRDKLHVAFQKALVSFWEGHAAQGWKDLAALADKAREQKDAYAEYEIGLGQAFLAPDLASEVERLDTLESALSKPVAGMAENNRNTALASLLRERVRILTANHRLDAAQQVIDRLKDLAIRTRDQIIEDCFESAQGYLFFAQGQYSDAVDELNTDTQSPLVARQIVLAYEKLGDQRNLEAARNRLKYLRAPTPQWYLASHAAPTN